MGIIIKNSDLPNSEIDAKSQLIIYCHPDQTIKNQAVSINIEMAKSLSAVKPNRRAIRMEQCFQHVLSTLPDNVVICDFDVMFNPDYAIDVMKILCSSVRIKPFRVIWPGKCEDGRLIYAEEGFRDYKVFEIDKYDVICVI